MSSYVLQNNQLFDVPGRRQSPYQTRALFVAAPSREVASSRTVTFMLPRALFVEYLPASPGASAMLVATYRPSAR